MTKMDEWCERVRRTLAASPPAGEDSAFVDDLVEECKHFIEREENVQVPTFALEICDDEQFTQLLRRLGAPQRMYSVPAISAGRGANRIVGINLNKFLPLLQGPHPEWNFVCNLALAIMEELVHVTSPGMSETRVNEMTNVLTERFLSIEIPKEIREEFARIVAENESTSNERRNQS
jgi:hypothetical protein